MDDRWLSIDAIGAYLGVQRDMAYNWISENPCLPTKSFISENLKKMGSIRRCTKMAQVRPVVSMMGKNNHLARFGFSFKRGGAHTSRTMMLRELRLLLAYVDRPEADKSDYLQAVDDENCLAKRSGKNRLLTYRHLVDLYSLDRRHLLFRTLLYFWHRDIDGQALVALLCTYARDPIFRSTAPFILKFPEGAPITRKSLEEFIDSQEPGRFSAATLRSTAQNINATWTQSGYLGGGRAKKVRACANSTSGSVSYALLLGYLSGARGQALFQTEYIKLLNCTCDKAIELAEEASRKGWIVFNRVGNVMEALFPDLINQEEMGWLREQS